MAEERDLFDEMSDEPQEEQQPFEELPADAWVLMKTATSENGGAAPQVRTDESKKERNADGSPVLFRKFNVGLYTIGGDDKILPKHRNKTLFFSTFVLPSAEDTKRNPALVLGGRLVGFLNAIFAKGVADAPENHKKDALKERAAARWKATIEKLRPVWKEHPEATPEAYQGSRGRLLAYVACCALEHESHLVLVKTRKGKPYDRDGEMVSRIEAGMIEDATPENIAKRKVRLLEGVEETVEEQPDTTF